MRNDLLADIVTALGGTVTDRNNRNLLLNDWLSALQNPSIEYVAQLDGLTKYLQLSEPLPLQFGDIVSFGLAGFQNNGTFKRFFGSSDFTLSLDTGADGDKFRLRSILSATLNSSSITSDQTLIPTSGLNEVSVEIGGTKDITTLLSLGSTNLLRAAIYDFKVIRGGAVIHEIPLTNKDQGATQLATVGTINATMIGYTGNEWVDRSTL